MSIPLEESSKNKEFSLGNPISEGTSISTGNIRKDVDTSKILSSLAVEHSASSNKSHKIRSMESDFPSDMKHSDYK